MYIYLCTCIRIYACICYVLLHENTSARTRLTQRKHGLLGCPAQASAPPRLLGSPLASLADRCSSKCQPHQTVQKSLQRNHPEPPYSDPKTSWTVLQALQTVPPGGPVAKIRQKLITN